MYTGFMVARDEAQKSTPKKQLSEIALPSDLTTTRDEVRNITFVEPKNAEKIPNGCSCYLYISDKGNGFPALILRCRILSDDSFHFDQQHFRIGTTLYTIKQDTLQMMHIDTISGRDYGSNDFVVSNGDNYDAIKALVACNDDQLARFYSTAYNNYKDFTLTKADLQLMRSVFTVWSDLAGR
jgi:hypothetical protein